MKNKLLPLRIGVGAIILNNENKVLVGKRKDNPIDKWQMPQGGVEKNEDYVDAMKRELFEETSVTSIKILKEFDEWLEYELPNNLVGIIWKGKFRGQKQKWFISRFTGNDSEINIKTNHPEFIDWKLIKMNELHNIIVDFKKDIYKKILIKLREFIN